MKTNKQCVVVIPIHNENPSNYEQISFKQCFNIIKKNPIVIVIPKGLNMDNYKKIVHHFDVIEIDPKWQSSIQMYNKLKLSDFFYSLFSEYEYLLTYELDAFIFRDEIEYWCNKNIDFIGAPWLKAIDSTEIIGIGNSGFSLRNIKKMRYAIKKINFAEHKHCKITFRNRIISRIKQPLNYVLNLFFENKTIQNSIYINEDWFIAFIIPKYIKDFKIASPEDAIKFSFEVNPGFLFTKNNSILSMGCHAWEKYDINFWKPHINKFGYKI